MEKIAQMYRITSPALHPITGHVGKAHRSSDPSKVDTLSQSTPAG